MWKDDLPHPPMPTGGCVHNEGLRSTNPVMLCWLDPLLRWGFTLLCPNLSILPYLCLTYIFPFHASEVWSTGTSYGGRFYAVSYDTGEFTAFMEDLGTFIWNINVHSSYLLFRNLWIRYFWQANWWVSYLPSRVGALQKYVHTCWFVYKTLFKKTVLKQQHKKSIILHQQNCCCFLSFLSFTCLVPHVACLTQCSH